jgi:formylglycine-generating enzyme required for sulfatase activity
MTGEFLLTGEGDLELGNVSTTIKPRSTHVSRSTPTFLTVLLLAPLAALHAAEPITNSIGMKLVRIEAGTFTMGQDGPPIAGNGDMATHHAEFRAADWDEKPAHRVTLTQPFLMSVTEVTLGQFRQFEPEFRKGKGADDEAVDAITWSKAVAFCEWLTMKEGKTYRLPTEAEGEYACRAGPTTRWWHGDDDEKLAEIGNVADGTAKGKFPKWERPSPPRTVMPSRRRWASLRPIRSGCTTCMGTCGSQTFSRHNCF